MDRISAQVQASLPPHHPGLPKLLLPAGLGPDLVATLNVLPFILIEPRGTTPDADHIAALMAEVIAPIVPGGAAHQFCCTPPQAFTRLLHLAALCVETANTLARETELTADPMQGFDGRGFAPAPAIVSVPA